MKITPKLVAITQGIYFLLTAVWPFLHLKSFLFVTGPKTDIWLLYTVSMLLLVIGLVLLLSGIRKAVSFEIRVLAVTSAIGLMAIDMVYSTNHTISDIYRFDALTEAVLLLGWAIARPELRSLKEQKE